MSFELPRFPARQSVGFLDPSIAGEGEKVHLMVDGQQITFNPPPPKPAVPDWSTIKSIRHYFNRTDPPRPYPAWIYHETQSPKLIRDRAEGETLGIRYRKTTSAEYERYRLEAVWDWDDSCPWRPSPYPGTMGFDPKNPGQGKEVINTANPVQDQHNLVRQMIPAVAAAVIQAMGRQSSQIPSTVDPIEWAEFQKFRAWQKTTEVVPGVVSEAMKPESEDRDVDLINALSGALTPAAEHSVWSAQAERLGIKVDKRWGIDRLKQEVEKASE